MATDGREARRRRILERGSDRLALITGQIQTLPSSSSSSHPPTHLEDSEPSFQPLISHDHQDPHPQTPDQIPVFSPAIEEKGSESKCDTKTEETLSPTASQEVQPLPPSSTDQKASSSSSSSPQQRSLFTLNQISSAIAASESTRLCCSVAVALLVVLSHLGFPLLGRNNIVKNLLSFKPLYLVLLTSVTLVLARVLGRQRVSERPDRGGEIIKAASVEGYEWAAQLGKALEVGLLVRKVLDALFMDCAVYAIIVVCGVSSAQQFR